MEAATLTEAESLRAELQNLCVAYNEHEHELDPVARLLALDEIKRLRRKLEAAERNKKAGPAPTGTGRRE